MRLDRTDFGILEALQDNARLSNKELAAMVGVSPSTCLERVRRLRSQNVIRGFSADTDPKAMGIDAQALVAIRLDKHAQASPEALKRSLLELPEVRAVYVLAGVDDFLIHVVAASVDHLREIVNQSFVGKPNVAHIQTSLIFDYGFSQKLPNLNEVNEAEEE